MPTGKDPVHMEAMNRAVNIGDVRVQPGDILRGDADGAVAIPKERKEEILSVAEEIDASRPRSATSSAKE